MALATTVTTDVLVIGGGTSGVAAGIQAARMGARTIIAEETTWLGGMLSAAGVSATDGNHLLPSGIWGEFRDRVYRCYGGPAKVATGWVSNTHFEPHVADSIFKSMAAAEQKLQVRYLLRFIGIIQRNHIVKGARFADLATGDTLTIHAGQVIDATELGDAMAAAGARFNVGMEASAETGENVQVPVTNDIIQDLTYVAILKDYGKGADCTIARPVGYDPREFDGCCLDFYDDKSRIAPNVDCAKMMTYAKLPHQKYLINWPGFGNDFYLNLIGLTPEQRQTALLQAKQQTLRYIYFLQHQLGYKHLGLADDEFPTADRLALIPYHREARRVEGLVRYKVQHISDPFNESHPLYRTGIAVGDYPIDHHHRKNPLAPQHLGFYAIPSFNVPLGALIPAKVQGLIVAEKSISVSNVVNGTTRLQPCVLLIGQAAGTLAALTVQQADRRAQGVKVRAVQQALLASAAYLMPYADVPVTDPHFMSIQRIGATGFMRGKGQPNAWANRTWFNPDSLINTATLVAAIPAALLPSSTAMAVDPSVRLSLKSSIELIARVGAATPRLQRRHHNKWNTDLLMQAAQKNWQQWGLDNFDTDRPLLRRELAVLLDKTLNPFDLYTIDHQGVFQL